MDEVMGNDEKGRVESSHDPDSGNDERHQAGGLDGDPARSKPPARTRPRRELDRLHGRGMAQRGADAANGDAHLGAPVQPPIPGLTSLESFEYRESPFPPPSEIAEYAAIDPQFARDIFDMVKATQKAQIDAKLIPVRAEARALVSATNAVAWLPWMVFAVAGVLAVLGQDGAALITAGIGALGGGAQIISSTRRPKDESRPRGSQPSPVGKHKA